MYSVSSLMLPSGKRFPKPFASYSGTISCGTQETGAAGLRQIGVSEALGHWLLSLAGLVSHPLLTALILLLCKKVPQHQWVLSGFNLATQLALVKKSGGGGQKEAKQAGTQAHACLQSCLALFL